MIVGTISPLWLDGFSKHRHGLGNYKNISLKSNQMVSKDTMIRSIFRFEPY